MKIALAILALLIFNPVYAQEESKHKRPLESWYYQVSAGINYPLYKGHIHSIIDRVEKITSSHQSNGEVSLMGIYLPIASKTHSLIGFKFLNGSWVSYDDEIISLHFIGASYIHYFRQIGHGFYINFDLGRSGIVYKDSKIGEPEVDESGFAGRLGAGYAIPIFSETSLLLSVHNTTYKFDVGTVNSLSFNLGFLW